MKNSKNKDMEKFWLVVNFESSHWLMADACKFSSEAEAIAKAKDLASKYPHYKYHILKPVGVARAKYAPVEVIKY